MRVSWDMTFAARSVTGTRVYTHNLYRALDALGETQLQEMYGARDAGGAMSAAQNVWWLWRGLEQRLRADAPDLFHAAAYLGPRRVPCPMIVNVFDVSYLTYPKFFDWKWNLYARTVIPRTVRQAAAIVTLTEHARGEIVNAYQVPRARVHLVPPGIGAEFQPVLDAALGQATRARYALPEMYLLYVGALNGRKNIPALVGALAQLRQEFPQLGLVLAGPHGAETQRLERTMRAYGVENAVRLTGYVSAEDLPRLYAGARAFVYASKLEGFGMPPVEAMACGTPVIAAPNPPLPEVLGEAAYFSADDSPAALAQAIARVLRDDVLAQTLRTKGLARAREYTWAGAARATMNVYANVLAISGRAVRA